MARGTDRLDEFLNKRLHLAVQKEESTEDEIVQEIQALLEIGTDPNVRILNSAPVLEIAMSRKMKKVVDLLLAFKADVNSVNFEPFFKDEHTKISKLAKEKDSEIQRKHVESESARYIEWLISRGFDFDRKNQDGKSALLIAINYSLHHILPVLFKHTQDINYISEDKETLLYLYLERSDVDVWQREEYFSSNVRILLDRGLSTDTQDVGKKTPIHAAINQRRSCDVIKMLVQHSTHVNRKDYRGETALHRVIDKWTTAEEKDNDDYKELADFLLAKGANIDGRGEEKDDFITRAPLFYAVYARRIDIAEYLRGKGARFDIKCRMGRRTLLHSLFITKWHQNYPQKDLAIIDILVSSGCDVNATDNVGWTALHYAAKDGELDIFQRLLEHGADVNIRNNRLETPVFEAVRRRHHKIVDLLALHGADLTARSIKHESAMEIFIKETECWRVTEEYQTIQVLTALIAGGYDVNSEDFEGQTPLHIAARYSNIHIVKKLIKKGASVHCRTRLQETPLHFGSRNPNVKPMLQLLIECEANVDVKDSMGQTALHTIAYESRAENATDGIRVLLEYSAESYVKDTMNFTPLCSARVRNLDDFNRRRRAWVKERNRGHIAAGRHPVANIDMAPVMDVPDNVVTMLIRHAFLRKSLKLKYDKKVDGMMWLLWAPERNPREFRRRYVQQVVNDVRTVRQTFIIPSVSLYHFLHMDLSQQRSYLYIDYLKTLVISRINDPALARCATVIRGAYHEAVAWKSLEEPAKQAWLSLTNIYLPDLCLELIFAFLRSGDLRQMIGYE